MFKTYFIKGPVVINSIKVNIEHDDIIAYTVDLKTKHAHYAASHINSDGTIKIELQVGSHTDISTIDKKESALGSTYIGINAVPGWYVFSANVHHCEMFIVLYKI